MNNSAHFITFISHNGTQYQWNNALDIFVNLSDKELNLLKLKVSLMSDNTILNRHSSNGVAMGIPVKLSTIRLHELSKKLISIIEKKPNIILSDHVIERLLLEGLDETTSRGWLSEENVKYCILTAKSVCGIRLTVDYSHKFNTEKIKYLHPHFALIVQGKKENNEIGRLVLVIFDNNDLRVVTIL